MLSNESHIFNSEFEAVEVDEGIAQQFIRQITRGEKSHYTKIYEVKYQNEKGVSLYIYLGFGIYGKFIVTSEEYHSGQESNIRDINTLEEALTIFSNSCSLRSVPTDEIPSLQFFRQKYSVLFREASQSYIYAV